FDDVGGGEGAADAPPVVEFRWLLQARSQESTAAHARTIASVLSLRRTKRGSRFPEEPWSRDTRMFRGLEIRVGPVTSTKSAIAIENATKTGRRMEVSR